MEWRATFRRALLLIATFVAATVPFLAAAQSGAANVTLVAGGFAFPRGSTWDETADVRRPRRRRATAHCRRRLLRNDRSSTPSASSMRASMAAVVKVDKGCGVPVATGLPSEQQSNRWHQGVASLAFLDGTLYAAEDGGGSARGNPINPSGVYMVGANGGWAAVASLDAWMPCIRSAWCQVIWTPTVNPSR